MKILVGTKETQGQQEGDFCWTEEDEILAVSATEVVGQTAKTLIGVNSRRSTTTFKVADSDLTPDEYAAIVLQSNERAGLPDVRIEPSMKLLDVAALYDVGDVLDKWGTYFNLRVEIAV